VLEDSDDLAVCNIPDAHATSGLFLYCHWDCFFYCHSDAERGGGILDGMVRETNKKSGR